MRHHPRLRHALTNSLRSLMRVDAFWQGFTDRGDAHKTDLLGHERHDELTDARHARRGGKYAVPT